jgi:hypothetical protein
MSQKAILCIDDEPIILNRLKGDELLIQVHQKFPNEDL